MKYKQIIGIALVFFILIGVFFVSKAQQTTNSLQVHPSNFDLTIQPGQPTTEIIYLENRTDQNVPIKVDLRNFTALGEEGSVNLTTENTTYSLAAWMNVSPATNTISPHATGKFTVTIKPPFNAEPGGHFGSVVFATMPPKDLKKTGALLSQEIASLFLVRIPGNTEEKAVIESFDTDKQFYEFGPVNFLIRVRNEGQVHIQPAGSIIIKGTFGDHYEVPLDRYNILPNSIRRIPAVLHNHILIGKYTATLIAAYGTKNEQLIDGIIFYAFPWRYGLIVFGILIFLLIIRKRLWKAMKTLATGK